MDSEQSCFVKGVAEVVCVPIVALLSIFQLQFSLFLFAREFGVWHSASLWVTAAMLFEEVVHGNKVRMPFAGYKKKKLDCIFKNRPRNPYWQTPLAVRGVCLWWCIPLCYCDVLGAIAVFSTFFWFFSLSLLLGRGSCSRPARLVWPDWV